MLALIKKRRSIREYTDQAVPDEQVRALLEAAMAAPSASNRQPWEFVVVRRKDLRRKLGEMKTWSFMWAAASVVFVVLGNERRSVHWVEDTSAATENMLLAAVGLGVVWMAVYPNQEHEDYVRALLNVSTKVPTRSAPQSTRHTRRSRL